MNLQDSQAIKKIFAEYYENAEFPIPEIEKREFGFGNIKKIDARHLNFATVSEFKRYLATNTPLFVSHSTSYYDFPGATPIQKKQWKRADLVFDLDIHAEGKYGAYAKLNEVKSDLIRLINDFVLNDFGIKKEHVLAVFSGNRGYHIHVRDPAFLGMGGEERRELVDYVMGQGLDYTQFFTEDDKKRLIGPKPDESGYRGRLARGVTQIVREKPNSISRVLSKEKGEFFISGINEGNWSKTSLKFNDLISRLKIIADGLPIHCVDTDVGVTQDLSKLIRVPNSIHGETGMVAKIIDDVEKFVPWNDAMIKTDKEYTIKFTEDVPELMIESGIGPFKKDNEKKLPQHLAVFFVCKGSAVFV